MVAFDSALARKLTRYLPLGQDELAVLGRLEAQRRSVAAGHELVHERQVGHHAFILEEGWACSYKLLPDGGRQVIDFPIPGDVIGLRSVLLRASDHSFAAVTDVTVAEVSAQKLIAAFERQPRLGVAFLWAASRDEAMVVEHLVNIGRRSALVRIAHFLVELGLRLQVAGLGSETGFACPLEPVSAGRCGRAHRDPRQPHPAPAARAQAPHVSRLGTWRFTISPASASLPTITAAISTRATAETESEKSAFWLLPIWITIEPPACAKINPDRCVFGDRARSGAAATRSVTGSQISLQH